MFIKTAYPLITPVPAQQVWLSPPEEAVMYHGPPFLFLIQITWFLLSFSSLKAQSVFKQCPLTTEL